MEVRRLTAEERAEAAMISAIAFHMRLEDPEKAREEAMRETQEDWGAFAEDGRMAARIKNHLFESWLDGQTVYNGGIGLVSTLPEYRETGAVRAIFHRLLPEAYRRGEVVSTLYPFSHEFYRKFGYETVCWRNEYEMEPEVLRGYRFCGAAELWKPGDPVSEYTAFYNRFASGYNLAVRRDDAMMLEKHLKGEYFRDRKFGYLLRENGTPVAYVIFRDIRHDPAAILSVEDAAWEGRAGLDAILGFLGRFSADYGTIRMSLPSCLQLLSVIRTPRAYDIRQTVCQDYMIRVVNVRKALEVIRKPEGARFTVRVSDGLIPENCGTWTVEGGQAALTEETPDLEVSVQALGQLICGSVSLPEAEYRPDVSVRGNRRTLEQIFVRRPILAGEHF